MKSATGEANLTVIAILLIAVVISIATPLVMSLMRRQTWKACCTNAGGIVRGQTCDIRGNVFESDELKDGERCIDMDEVIASNPEQE